MKVDTEGQESVGHQRIVELCEKSQGLAAAVSGPSFLNRFLLALNARRDPS